MKAVMESHGVDDPPLNIITMTSRIILQFYFNINKKMIKHSTCNATIYSKSRALNENSPFHNMLSLHASQLIHFNVKCRLTRAKYQLHHHQIISNSNILLW